MDNMTSIRCYTLIYALAGLAGGCVGPQGPAGSPGPKGDVGPAGSQGPSNPGSTDSPAAVLAKLNEAIQGGAGQRQYVKLLMRAHGSGGWKTFVTGPKGNTCSSLCSHVRMPDGTSLTCSAWWADGHVVQRATPPGFDPYLGYDCGSTGYPNATPMCMCELGALGHTDAQLSFDTASGLAFW